MKCVENYFIEYFNSGIIHLLFNTKERWVYFHQMNDHQYQIGGNSDMEFEVEKEYRVNIPEDKLIFKKFHFGKSIFYISTVIQNKDQISFYFIPTNLIMDGDVRMIYDSNFQK